jgi:hypothetical protein
MKTIVIAKVEQEIFLRPGASPRFRDTALAAVWLNEGTDEDLKKATAYATKDGWQVLTFPCSEPDPLGRARKQVLRKKAN